MAAKPKQTPEEFYEAEKAAKAKTQCTVCESPLRSEIDRAYQAGIPITSLERWTKAEGHWVTYNRLKRHFDAHT